MPLKEVNSGRDCYFNNAVAHVVQHCDTGTGWLTWTENGKERHCPTWFFKKYANPKN